MPKTIYPNIHPSVDYWFQWTNRNLIGDQRDTVMEMVWQWSQVAHERDAIQSEYTESLQASIKSSGELMASLVNHTLNGGIRWGYDDDNDDNKPIGEELKDQPV